VVAGEWAEVRIAGALVYSEPDTESRVLAELAIGTRFVVSKELYGDFRRIKVKDQLSGFILDQDVITLRELNSLTRLDVSSSKVNQSQSRGRAATQTARVKPEPLDDKISAPEPVGSETKRLNHRMTTKKPELPYELERFRGAKISALRFREETMGLVPTEILTLFGVHFAGPRVADDFYTDLNLQFFFGAPGYYERGTGESAQGFMFLPSFLLQAVFPQGRDTLFFYGLGPFLKYSSWQVSLPRSSGRKDDFDLTDMAVGAIFNVGVGVRFNSFNARLEFQHYWEKLHYSGLGFSVGFPF
jgi:hypothetical protein